MCRLSSMSLIEGVGVAYKSARAQTHVRLDGRECTYVRTRVYPLIVPPLSHLSPTKLAVKKWTHG